MSGIIVYKSKYGASKKYAQMISEETGFRCVSVKEADINEVAGSDVIIIGGGIYASGFAFTSFLKKNIGKLKGKKVIAYACGASPYEEKFINAVIGKNMQGDLAGIPVFYCRGSFDMKEMAFMDKTLCNMLRKSLLKKDPKEMEVWESALVEATDSEAHDWTDKSYIAPILEAIKK